MLQCTKKWPFLCVRGFKKHIEPQKGSFKKCFFCSCAHWWLALPIPTAFLQATLNSIWCYEYLKQVKVPVWGQMLKQMIHWWRSLPFILLSWGHVRVRWVCHGQTEAHKQSLLSFLQPGPTALQEIQMKASKTASSESGCSLLILISVHISSTA